MKKFGKNFVFSFKELGYFKYIMYAVVIIVSLFCGLNQILPISVFETFEMFIFPLSGWWIIQEYYCYIDEDDREVFLSYPISRKYVGMLKYICTLACFSVPIIIDMAFLVGGQDDKIFYIEMLSESLFWISLGYFLIILVRNIVVSVGIIWIYASIQILDVSGDFRPISVCFYFVADIMTALIKIIVLLVTAIILFICAQERFVRTML